MFSTYIAALLNNSATVLKQPWDHYTGIVFITQSNNNKTRKSAVSGFD